MQWSYGNPDKAGYYLAAWMHEDAKPRVSELWFNPLMTQRWYLERANRYEGSRAVLKGVSSVFAWMPMPEAPGGQASSPRYDYAYLADRLEKLIDDTYVRFVKVDWHMKDVSADTNNRFTTAHQRIERLQSVVKSLCQRVGVEMWEQDES